MTVRGTVALAAILATLALWITVIDGPPAPADAPPAAGILATPPSEVDRVELTSGDTTLTAVRAPTGGWVDGNGRALPTDRVVDLLDTLAALRPVSRIVPDPREVARYGLGEQRLTLRRRDGSVALELEIGQSNPAESALYVRSTGQTEILLLGSVLRWEIQKLVQAHSATGVPPSP